MAAVGGLAVSRVRTPAEPGAAAHTPTSSARRVPAEYPSEYPNIAVRLVHPSERRGAARRGAALVDGPAEPQRPSPLRKRTGVPDGCMQRARLPVGHIVPRWTRAAPTIEVAARSDGRMAGFAQAVRLLAVLTEHMQQDRAVAACHPASSAVPTRPDRILPHRLP